jgi:LDH2 family malate/lactate/ureidoglycolate dehydrogenase
VNNSTHFGAANYSSLMAAKLGLIGIAMSNGNPAVAPPSYTRPLIGTNAFSVACPCDDQNPLVLDMAMSVTSLGYLEEMEREGKTVPAYFAATVLRSALIAGQNDHISPAVIYQQRMLAPCGGQNDSRGEYKGFALSSVVELLTAILSGGRMSFQLDRGGACHFFAAIRADMLQDPSSIKQSLILFSEMPADTPTLDGNSILRMPGSRSNQTYAERSIKGIPLPISTVEALRKLADRVGVVWSLDQISGES